MDKKKLIEKECRRECEETWNIILNLSRRPIIRVGSEVKDFNMQRNGYHNIIHSFILGIGIIGYEIGS